MNYPKPPSTVYYVYAHRKLDSGEIFYIGKGKEDRAYSIRGRNRSWVQVVAKHGFEVCFLHTDLGESRALDLEMEEISKLKRAGVRLVNMTAGGEGLSGYVFSEASRKKCSENNSMRDPENRKKVSVALKRVLATPEAKANRSKISKEIQSRPEVVAKARARRHSDATKQKMSASSAMKRPEVAAKFRGDNNPAKRPGVGKKISEAKMGYRHTEEAKRKMSASHSGKTLSEDHKAKLKVVSTGRLHTDEAKAKMAAEFAARPKLTCPHCGTIGHKTVAKRWHFDNCKHKIPS